MLGIGRSAILCLFFCVVAAESIESVIEKYKEQLKGSSSDAKEQLAILWSLAELAVQIDHSVTSKEVDSEISYRAHEILERVEISDAVLREEFNAIRAEFARTKEEVMEAVQATKDQIMADVRSFGAELVESLQTLVESSYNVQEGWLESGFHRVRSTFGDLEKSALIRSVIFFSCFQVILILGLVFYKKLDNQLRMFL
jgi:hypothetical protein